jgi:RHS repeat-associated protein
MSDLDRYQYGYDQNSNRLWKANVVGTATVGNLDEGYSYDNLNRLTQMQRGTLSGGIITGTPAREMDYTLDPTGNWAAYLTKTSGTTDLNQTRSHNMVNEIEVISGTPGWASPPVYDAAGNMTSFPQPASPSSVYTAVYDAWNRLTQVNAGSSTVAEYQYDGFNRRAVKLTYSGGTLSETRHFYWTNDWQDIEERIGTSTSMDNQYVWGARYIDELICRDDATPQRLYACQDANFNVTALVDTAGTMQQRFLYDPYGNSEVLTSSWGTTTDAYAWTRRFTGQFFDQESQIYFYRARYYHPQLGRFIGRDPIGIFAALNLYIYTLMPIQSLDPYGLEEITIRRLQDLLDVRQALTDDLIETIKNLGLPADLILDFLDTSNVVRQLKCKGSGQLEVQDVQEDGSFRVAKQYRGGTYQINLLQNGQRTHLFDVTPTGALKLSLTILARFECCPCDKAGSRMRLAGLAVTHANISVEVTFTLSNFGNPNIKKQEKELPPLSWEGSILSKDPTGEDEPVLLYSKNPCPSTQPTTKPSVN